jgi:hypothetical protein
MAFRFAPPEKHEVPGTASDEPPRRDDAEPPEAARHQVDAVGAHQRGRRLLDVHRLAGEAQDDLAHVPGLSHAMERFARCRRRERLDRQRSELPALHAAGELAQESTRTRRAFRDESGDVDEHEREVVAERIEPYTGAAVDVTLADLDEPAIRGEHGDALLDRLAGQRVQDDVHADAARRLEHPGREVERPRIPHVLDPE